jgi:CubicO group peptidase (beta-lactamase class C family)
MTNNINDFLKKQVNDHQTPSIQYAFFDTDNTIFEVRHGMKRVQTREPLSTSTTYHLFSITKTFTAVAVLQLVQSGKIELNKPVSDYLPGFAYSNYITVEQLLNHTAGIPNPMPLRWIHLDEDHGRFDRNKFFAEIFRKHPKLDFPPGSDCKYSNLGYVVLGQLIEQVSEMSFETYVDQNIIKKLALTQNDLSFKLDTSAHAVGYHKRWSMTNAFLGFLIDKGKFMASAEGKWKPFRSFYNNGTAYGGIFGSAPGLTRYAQALLDDNSVLLDERHKRLLFTESVVAGKPTGMSLSWFTGTLKGNRYLAHAGGGGGYYVELRVYPDLGVGSVIMYNRSGMRDERVLDQADGFFITEAR